ncbi:MAG: ATP-binding cassette domain-containing protein [Ilumatobacteraceae bacterium]|nr:ATP-binding cassette domain-containing protein [Ilumatobacteraceae bacterium]
MGVSNTFERRKTTPGARNNIRNIAIFAAIAIALELMFGDSLTQANLVNLWMFYACVSIGFYYLFGVSGQFAFSQAAMTGVGAYTSAWASRDLPVVPAIIFATLVTAVIGGLFVLALRKASHFYFGIGTLALSETYHILAIQWNSFTGGEGGEVYGIKPLVLFGVDFTGDKKAFWLMLVVACGVLTLGAMLERSPVIRESKATRDQRTVADTLGIPHLRSRVTMFMLGSAVAGFVGAVYSHWKMGLSPNTFGLELGLGVFLMVILGGLTSKWGAVLGAAFYVWVPELISFVEEFKLMVYGGILLIVIIRLPEGLIGIEHIVMSRVHKRRHKDAAETPASIAETVVTDLPDGLKPNLRSGEANILATEAMTVRFGGNTAVNNVSLELKSGEVLGLVGPNGSGKSTFLNAVTGVVPAEGMLSIYGQQIPLGNANALKKAGISRTYQSPQTYLKLTCLEDVLLSTSDRKFTGVAAAILRPFVTLKHERARWAIAEDALDWVGLRHLADVKVAQLTYGQRRLLELARAIAGKTSTLLLDEPSAGLNASETEVLGEYLMKLHAAGVSILIVDHKVDFLNSICDRIAVLNVGNLITIGTPDTVWDDSRVVDAYLGTQ